MAYIIAESLPIIIVVSDVAAKLRINFQNSAKSAQKSEISQSFALFHQPFPGWNHLNGNTVVQADGFFFVKGDYHHALQRLECM